MNKKTDFQIRMDESKTYYRLIKKQEAPSSLLGMLWKKKKPIRKYVTAYGEVDDKTFQTKNLQGVRYQNLMEETGEMQTQTMFGKAPDVPYKLPSSFK